jgi:hypothetical protein
MKATPVCVDLNDRFVAVTGRILARAGYTEGDVADLMQIAWAGIEALSKIGPHDVIVRCESAEDADFITKLTRGAR